MKIHKPYWINIGNSIKIVEKPCIWSSQFGGKAGTSLTNIPCKGVIKNIMWGVNDNNYITLSVEINGELYGFAYHEKTIHCYKPSDEENVIRLLRKIDEAG